MKIYKQVIVNEEIELDIKGASLLSIDEAEMLLTEQERAYNEWWWLRSSGSYQDRAACVFYDGSVHYFGNSVHNECGYVRPILEIENHNLKLGDIFIFANKKFKVISDTSAFCLNDIGEYCFRKDWKSDDANDYEKSNIKKYVDDWFTNAIGQG